MNWTKEDEKILNEMLKRKSQSVVLLREGVERAVDTYLTVYDPDEVTDDLIAHATEFRKVLEPFDKEFKA